MLVEWRLLGWYVVFGRAMELDGAGYRLVGRPGQWPSISGCGRSAELLYAQKVFAVIVEILGAR